MNMSAVSCETQTCLYTFNIISQSEIIAPRFCFTHSFLTIQGMYKRMTRFPKLIKMHFWPYIGTTYTISNGNCPSFSCATNSSLLMLPAGPRDQISRWRRSRRRLSVCSVLRCPDLWLQCSVSFVQGLKNTIFLCFFVFRIFLVFIPEMSIYCSDYPHLFHLDPVTTAI
jgi:hypothetical protein